MTEPDVSAVYSWQFLVSDEMIDRNGHVNNVKYVQWMQDAAVAHSRAAIGEGVYTANNSTWVARSHHIEYLLPAVAGDTIEVRTWLASCRRVRCTRRYQFLRVSDGAVLAKGETNWVYVDASSGKPKSIPEAILNAFTLMESP